MKTNIIKLDGSPWKSGPDQKPDNRTKPKRGRMSVWRAIGKGIRLIFRLLAAMAMFSLFFVMALLRGPIKVALASIALLGLVGGAGIILAVPEMRFDQQLLLAGMMGVGTVAFLAWYWYDLFLCWIDPVLQKYMRG